MKTTTNISDAIVVGGGHAGIETALSIARAGYQVVLMTMDKTAIGRMSCNPAIGGLAKGHMVRELDALGGEMGKAIDATGIQFRMLNRSRGPAVWAPRAQADKHEYSEYMQRVVNGEDNLTLVQAHATEILVENGKCCGIKTQDGEVFSSKAVILTTGTFLQGLIHVGSEQRAGGRTGEKPAIGLSDSLRKIGIDLIRFKTGTPPRLLDSSIDWDSLEIQHGDEEPQPFSFQTEKIECEQHPCYITFTNDETHRIIKENLNLSPLYGGKITGTGPRYCPSIEDKVVKFAEKPRHQIYLEPEGLNTNEIYVNGLSTSLPAEVQEKFIHTIPGCEKAEIVRMGYAIEYDCAPPTQLKHSLETKAIENLFLAGQINCTSGYEEAAAQGLMAGLNVIRKLRDQEEFILDRSEAYIGVLIDDLVTRGTNEPYRMFTSRAEFRLLLRQDNADDRLMRYGHEFGLIPDEVFAQYQEKYKRITDDIKKIRDTRYEHYSLDKYLKRPEISYKLLLDNSLHSSVLDKNEAHVAETMIKYEGYIARQLSDVKRFRRIENKQIPPALDYFEIKGISREAQDKLSNVRPVSIGQASRIPGISACDLSLIAVHIERLIKAK